MIKALILDFGGVVFTNKPKDQWIGEKGLLKIDSAIWDQAGLGLISDETLFEKIAQVYNVQSDDIKTWLFSRREPNKEFLDLLAKLKPGIKKAIINNGPKSIFRGMLSKFELPIKFDELMNSAEEGVKKPNSEIYLRACKRLGVEPSECLFIDDDEGNIKGAEALGMRAIYFKNVEDLEKEFVLLNLLK